MMPDWSWSCCCCPTPTVSSIEISTSLVILSPHTTTTTTTYNNNDNQYFLFSTSKIKTLSELHRVIVTLVSDQIQLFTKMPDNTVGFQPWPGMPYEGAELSQIVFSDCNDLLCLPQLRSCLPQCISNILPDPL